MIDSKIIYKIAKEIRKNVETKYTLPTIVNVENVNYTIPVITYILVSFVVKPSNINQRTVKGASNPNGERINRQVNKKNYVDMSRRVKEYIEKNNQNPNYVTILNEQKCSIILFIYCLSKIVVWYFEHDNTMPDYCIFDSRSFTKQNNAVLPSNSTDEVYNYFVKTFGRVTCIDEALQKIQGKGYSYYYDDKYSNKTSIDRIKNRQGINCTDATQVMKNVADGTKKYKRVDAIHVKCQEGDGHIRLRLQLSDNTYIYRDPASVLNGSSITNNWCMNGKLLAINPSWFLQNLNR